MATKKDLVEAQAFSRRRLVSAFVSGAPGGREVEPSKPMRAVAGSIAVSVLLVVGSLCFGLLKPSLPSGWNDNTLVIAKTSGARYVALKGTLFPVANTTSAHLLIDSSDFKVITVADSKIAKTPHGAEVGIPGAPDALPAEKYLIGTGWLSCTSATGGVQTIVSAKPRASVLGNFATVAVDAGQTFVITNGYRYLVPADTRAQVLRQLALDTVTPIQATEAWLNLFPAGHALVPLTIAHAGEPADPSTGLPEGSVIGSVFQVTRATGDSELYLLINSTQIVPLPPFDAALYALGSGSLVGDSIALPASQLGSGTTAHDPLVQTSWEWPTALPKPSTGVACAKLTAGPSSTPKIDFVTVANLSVPASGTTVNVDAGSGALVRGISASPTNRGTVLLVDQTGSGFEIAGGTGDNLTRLGYQPTDIVPIPQAWADLFAPGPVLSTAAAAVPVSQASTSH